MAPALSSFGCLDELIQLIYQGTNRFVLLSSVDHEQWSCKLGLTGPEGRWWSGGWMESDIQGMLGVKVSDAMLEKFAQKLAESIISGDIFVSNWSPSPNASIKLTFSPGSKKPMHMPLTEMDSKDAASFVSEIFCDIALKAKSRQCQLHGSNFAIPSIVAPVTSHASTITAATSSSKPESKKETLEDSDPQPSASAKKSAEGSKRKVPELSPDPEPKSKSVKAAPRPVKGASLANPNKKARKYQAIEFGSDEDED
ncbi:hypothetical protein PQX77_011816 [Marasmius sp. AFHP31]|nr:hypothetical protein PQX77_011816 [Marasmius sp. AFHP31]